MNKPEAEQIASAITTVRPQWLRTSLVSTLGNLPERFRDRPARDVMLALVWLAFDPQQQTPRLLREDGPWWNLASLTGPGTQPASVSATPQVCEHGNRPARCEKCAGVRHATGPTDEQRATIRAALAEAQELRKTQGTP